MNRDTEFKLPPGASPFNWRLYGAQMRIRKFDPAHPDHVRTDGSAPRCECCAEEPPATWWSPLGATYYCAACRVICYPRHRAGVPFVDCMAGGILE